MNLTFLFNSSQRNSICPLAMILLQIACSKHIEVQNNLPVLPEIKSRREKENNNAPILCTKV